MEGFRMANLGRRRRTTVVSEHCRLLQCPEDIIEKIFDLISDTADRNAISLVCKRLKVLEGRTRRVVLVSNCYAIQPLALKDRFPNAWSITIKGKPRIVDFALIPDPERWGAYATPWMEIVGNFETPILHLRMKRMTVSDSDIQLLVSRCGEGLQRLELEKCSGFSTFGLEIIARVCQNLIELNLSESEIYIDDHHSWITTLANRAKSLQVLDLSLTDVKHVEQSVLEKLAGQCITLKLCEAFAIERVLPVVRASNHTMRHLGISLYPQNIENPHQIAEAFGECKALQVFSASIDLDEGSMMMVMPIASRLTTLNLTYANLGQPELSDLLRPCMNLEDLQCTDVIGDRGLLEVGTHCQKLRRLVVQEAAKGFVTQHGLTAVANGCFLLEKIIIYAADMTNAALNTLANNCPGLSDIRICLVQKYHPSHPRIELEGNSTLNLGVRSLLMRCPRARRLALCFSRFGLSNVVITDEGIRYIGEYGGNLHIITLTNCGSTDAGLEPIAKGCKELRRFELRHCPFGDRSMEFLAKFCPSLKQLWVQACEVKLNGVKVLARREGLVVEVVKESTNENGGINPWHLIAYASVALPRDDRPDNIDYVHSEYNTPLRSENYVCPSIDDNLIDEDGPQYI